MLLIDGSAGEGGGQILRSSLALSLVTGKPFRLTGVRARRARPGLLRQHLTALRAAQAVGCAEVVGAELGSREVTFVPQHVNSGTYNFSVGTAGSATLVFQTVLPALMIADGPSTLVLEGGTHNPAAPPFEFLERAFLPIVERMGPKVSVKLERAGFYPAGGGRFTATITPAQLSPIDLLERGEIRDRSVHAVVVALPRRIAEREIARLAHRLDWPASCFHVEAANAQGPGNVVHVEIASEHVTEVFTGFGERGVRAEAVADAVADEALEYLAAADVPVGKHLADQLLLLFALAGGGRFRTLPLSAHARTQQDIIEKFLEVNPRAIALG